MIFLKERDSSINTDYYWQLEAVLREVYRPVSAVKMYSVDFKRFWVGASFFNFCFSLFCLVVDNAVKWVGTLGHELESQSAYVALS